MKKEWNFGIIWDFRMDIVDIVEVIVLILGKNDFLGQKRHTPVKNTSQFSWIISLIYCYHCNSSEIPRHRRNLTTMKIKEQTLLNLSTQDEYSFHVAKFYEWLRWKLHFYYQTQKSTICAIHHSIWCGNRKICVFCQIHKQNH